jgi:hypothetical protein
VQLLCAPCDVRGCDPPVRPPTSARSARSRRARRGKQGGLRPFALCPFALLSMLLGVFGAPSHTTARQDLSVVYRFVHWHAADFVARLDELFDNRLKASSTCMSTVNRAHEIWRGVCVQHEWDVIIATDDSPPAWLSWSLL